MSLLQSLLDASSHAVLTLDRQGIITHINQRAKQRFGLFNRSPHPHGAGRLEAGDVVILADTAIGADDGGLTPEDLACIGIQERRLRTGDRIVAVGQYQTPSSRAVYKFLPSRDADRLQLQTTFRAARTLMAYRVSGQRWLPIIVTCMVFYSYRVKIKGTVTGR